MIAVLAGLSSSTPPSILSGQAARKNVSLKSLGERETGGSLGPSHWSSLPLGESAAPVVALALHQHSGPDIQKRRLASQAKGLVGHITAKLGRCARFVQMWWKVPSARRVLWPRLLWVGGGISIVTYLDDS